MHFYNVSIILVFFQFFLIFENGFLYLVVVAFSSVDFFFLSYICIFKSSHFESKIVFFFVGNVAEFFLTTSKSCGPIFCGHFLTAASIINWDTAATS